MAARVPVTYTEADDAFVFECPHCAMLIQVLSTQINCAIFRHAVMKNGTEISPHLPKEECDRLVAAGLVYGCCKPYRFVQTTPPYVEPCDYI